MPINSRDKGARGERELASLCREHGYNARRGQQFSGANGDADVVGLDGVHLECKRTERLDLYGAMAQAVNDCKGRMPVVAHRRNNADWLMIVRADDFFTLYRAWVEDNDVKTD